MPVFINAVASVRALKVLLLFDMITRLFSDSSSDSTMCSQHPDSSLLFQLACIALSFFSISSISWVLVLYMFDAVSKSRFCRHWLNCVSLSVSFGDSNNSFFLPSDFAFFNSFNISLCDNTEAFNSTRCSKDTPIFSSFLNSASIFL